MIRLIGEPELVWAHRGRKRMAPENTMAAFKVALDSGDRGIEVDVTLSQDGFPVIIHDDSIDRTSDGMGQVRDLTLEELRSFDAGSWFDERFAGEKIPLLVELLDEMRLRQTHALLNIEIKVSAFNPDDSDGMEEIVLRLAESNGAGVQLLYSSFEWRSLQRLRSLDSRCALGVLAVPGADPEMVVETAQSLNAFSIHPFVRDVLQGVPEVYRKFPGKIFPHTVQDSETAERLSALGVDGYFADLPLSSL